MTGPTLPSEPDSITPGWLRDVLEHAGVPGAAELIGFEGDEGDEYWVGFKNFYVITRYNHSAMYAMAVYQLATELAQATDQATGSDATTASVTP